MPRGGARPGAGRPKGKPNRDKRALIELLNEKYPGYHPVLAMAEIANNPEHDVTLRFSAHKEIAQYVTPKRKAVEVSGEDGGPLVVEIVKFSDAD